MRVLLLNPSCKQDVGNRHERYYIRAGTRWPHSGVKRKGAIPHYLPFPFFLAYSASLLKKAGFEVQVIDAVALDLSEDILLEKIKGLKPDVVFYEVVSPTVDYDLVLAKKIKELTGSIIGIGGAHASIFGSEIIRDNKHINFALRGEYEWSFLELSKFIEGRGGQLPSGAVLRNGERIIDTGYPLPIDPLDRLPFPSRDIFPSNDTPNPTVYWDGFCQYRPAVQIQSSRGCAYRCYFCLWNQAIYNQSNFRSFSTKRVVDEMQELITKYKIREIYFDDDDFTTDKRRILSLCEEILRRNIKIKWSCMGNVANLTEEILGIMSESGCIGIKFGVESGSERILKNLPKPVDLKKIREIIKHCRKLGIKTHATFCLGFLGETQQDINKTRRLAKTLPVDSIQVSIATPYPGTRFFKMAQEQGILRNVDWAKYDGKLSQVVDLPGLDGKRLGKLRKKILMSWFLRRSLSLFWYSKSFRILLRSLGGLGVAFFLRQLVSVITDEWHNKEI